MRKADDGLRALITKNLRRPDWLMTPVETGGTHDGVADLYWAHVPTGASGWIECKASPGWAVGLEPMQLGWISDHLRAGVRCDIAIRARGVGSSGGTGDSLWLVRGSWAEVLAEHGLQYLRPEAILGVWQGPSRTWDWSAVAAALR